MSALKFDAGKCERCKTCDCLTKCQYLDIVRDTARAEILKIANGEHSFVLSDCVTCYACEEYCRQGNHPFYLIAERQEQLNVLPAPHPLVRHSVQLGIPWRGDLEIETVKEPVISMGVFPQLSHLIQGRLFEGVSLLSTDSRTMFHLFCQLMYLHYARPSVIHERLPKIMDNIAKHGVKEVIFFHDECYGTFASYAPAHGIEVPFNPVHFYDYLYRRLKELEADIKPVNFKVAYQRPCPARLSPDMQHFVDDIFNLIGVECVKRTYSGENALCCAAAIRGQQKKGRRQLAAELQRKNIKDMVDAGAQICVFNCPACMATLGPLAAKKGLMPMFMSDLCRLAICEQPATVGK